MNIGTSEHSCGSCSVVAVVVAHNHLRPLAQQHGDETPQVLFFVSSRDEKYGLPVRIGTGFGTNHENQVRETDQNRQTVEEAQEPNHSQILADRGIIRACRMVA